MIKIVAGKRVARNNEPGPDWFTGHELIDQEVTDAFKSGHARLYDSAEPGYSNQLVVIDGGKEK
jgi:hypothetical protein